MRKTLPVAVLLVLLLVGFRLLGALQPDWLPNVQPLAALFFFGAACLTPRLGLAVPFSAWLVSYPLANVISGSPVWAEGLWIPVLGFAIIAAIGRKFRDRAPALQLGGVVLSSLLFYAITNFACWCIDPLYAKNAAGLLQALWTGPAGFGPTWIFLRNGLIGDVLFAAMFLAATSRLPLTAPTRALVGKAS